MLAIAISAITLVSAGRESSMGHFIEHHVQKIVFKAQDATITTVINAVLLTDPTLNPLAVNVETKQGKVILHGTAPDTDASERLIKVAAAVEGVRQVDNQLKLKI